MIFLFWGEGMGWHQISKKDHQESTSGVFRPAFANYGRGEFKSSNRAPLSWPSPGSLGPQVFDKYVGRPPPPRLLHLSLHCLQLCPPRTKPLHWLQSATVETSKYSTQINLTKKKNHAGRTVHIISCSVNHSGPDCLKASSVFFF